MEIAGKIGRHVLVICGPKPKVRRRSHCPSISVEEYYVRNNPIAHVHWMAVHLHNPRISSVICSYNLVPFFPFAISNEGVIDLVSFQYAARLLELTAVTLPPIIAYASMILVVNKLRTTGQQQCRKKGREGVRVFTIPFPLYLRQTQNRRHLPHKHHDPHRSLILYNRNTSC